MNFQKGDCALLRTCPDDPACYFIGTVRKAEEWIPLETMGMIDIFLTNCSSGHYSNKTERAFHPEQVAAGKVILWL